MQEGGERSAHLPGAEGDALTYARVDAKAAVGASSLGLPGPAAHLSKLPRRSLSVIPIRSCFLGRCYGKEVWKKEIILQVVFKYRPEKGVFVQKVVQCFQQLVVFLCFSFVIRPSQTPLHCKYSHKSPSEATFILSAAISGFIDLVIRSSTPD